MPKDEDKSGLKPTNVGGQPSVHQNQARSIPRGVEALIKKAAVDPEFRQVLIEKRADAAKEIDLELTAVEAGMLNSIPQAQIEQIIDKTTVPDEHRRVFLGKLGAAMIAVLGMNLAAYAWEFSMTGIGADGPPFLEKKEPVVTVNSGRPVLEVNVADTGPDSVLISMRYACLFNEGVLWIYFVDDDKDFASEIDCRPDVLFVSKGLGEVTFQSVGKDITTEWLIASLLCIEPPCAYGVPGSLSDFLTQRKSREYFIGDRIVWNVVRFQKVWKPKG